MENMSTEIIDSILGYYDGTEESKELISSMCYYLKKNTTDIKLKLLCNEAMDKFNYCIRCNGKLTRYEYRELHDELDTYEYEDRIVWVCNTCGRED